MCLTLQLGLIRDVCFGLSWFHSQEGGAYEQSFKSHSMAKAGGLYVTFGYVDVFGKLSTDKGYWAMM